MAPPHPLDEHLPVVKTLRPLQPGTLKLVERHGDALVCVRYRDSADGTTRFTTVELVVDSRPVNRRAREREMVEVRIAWRETTLRARAKALGAQLDPQTALWRMPYRAARILGLADRVRRD